MARHLKLSGRVFSRVRFGMAKDSVARQRDRLRRRAGHVVGHRRPRTSKEKEEEKKKAAANQIIPQNIGATVIKNRVTVI